MNLTLYTGYILSILRLERIMNEIRT